MSEGRSFRIALLQNRIDQIEDQLLGLAAEFAERSAPLKRDLDVLNAELRMLRES